MTSKVVLLCGPSGSGKTRLASRLGLPVLRLDDFYRDGDDPGLPRSPIGIVDWDDPASWDANAAVRAICSLCRGETIGIPRYDLARSSATGTAPMTLDDASLFVADGIFASEIVDDCRSAGVLAVAICLCQPRVVTFWRRLARDLREHRKRADILVRRGVALARREPAVMARCREVGCELLDPMRAEMRIRSLRQIAE